jgi:alpha-galactosidase
MYVPSELKPKRSIGITMKSFIHASLTAFTLLFFQVVAAAKPLKIFILVGQSNMEGHAKIETFDYIGDDPKTAPLLKLMRGADGKSTVCDHVWISYSTGAGDQYGEGFGKLTSGYGSRKNPAEDGGKIGPEFMFGITMDKALKEPVLIIKTAWGGKSLHTDFRPPSAGPYVPTEEEREKWAAKPEKEKEKEVAAATGVFYRKMVEHVKFVTKDIKRVCPAYDEKQGYEIAGFVWLQGFNDLVAGDAYPSKTGGKDRDYTKYGEWLADFIRDVRKDFNAPKMPFVIGVLGVSGLNASENTQAFRKAMAAPASLPEFKDNVMAVQTAPFWSEELAAIDAKRGQLKGKRQGLEKKVKEGKMTKKDAEAEGKKLEAELITPAEKALWERGASNAGYHYLGCAKTFALMGKSFAEATLQLMKAMDDKKAHP